MAVRVYELSKKLGITNKELLEILKSIGVEVSSHISVLPNDIIELIEEEVKAKLLKNNKKIDKTENVDLKSVVSTNKEENIKDKNIKKESEPKIEIKNNLENNNNENEENSISLSPKSLNDIAFKIKKPVNDIILTLLKSGIVVSKNQILAEDVIKKIADIYHLKLIKHDKPQKNSENLNNLINNNLSQKGKLIEREPIIVVIGHVDHGKTTLLDYIRQTRVASKEKGGITQHLGAYEVNLQQGNIVFLDTPGHEAFSSLRSRGLRAADIAVLVVAADDGVMPQTIESINYAKSINIPIIVAINKIDKVNNQQIEHVKQQLSKYDLIPEEWGGKTPFVLISAKIGTGVSDLLDLIILQSKIMDLKTNISVPAAGYILEAKLEKGRGIVATVICQYGILKLGDYFIAGQTVGKVISLIDSYANRIVEIGPSKPVQVSGFESMPEPGDLFRVVSKQEYKNYKEKKVVFDEVSLGHKAIKNTGINIIIKSDNISSKEALLKSIDKLSKQLDLEINVVYAGISDITEKDVILAIDTKSIIYTFNVKILPSAYKLINKNNIIVKNFDIIYNLLEDIEFYAESLKPVKYTSKKIGQANVIKVFDIKSLGKIAGVYVKSGKLIRDCKIIVFRDNNKIAEGFIKSLQREKRSVKEVNTGFECAVLMDNFQDWELDDKIECYQDVKI